MCYVSIFFLVDTRWFAYYYLTKYSYDDKTILAWKITHICGFKVLPHWLHKEILQPSIKVIDKKDKRRTTFDMARSMKSRLIYCILEEWIEIYFEALTYTDIIFIISCSNFITKFYIKTTLISPNPCNVEYMLLSKYSHMNCGYMMICLWLWYLFPRSRSFCTTEYKPTHMSIIRKKLQWC